MEGDIRSGIKEGRFDAIAVCGPVPAGSLAHIVFIMEKATTEEEVNRIIREASQ
jgi:glyceraldehyde 3-phosphate dehydrogenase